MSAWTINFVAVVLIRQVYTYAAVLPNCRGRSAATQTMHDEKTLTAAEPAEAGEALARWVDADISFSRASASGRLYFQVNA